MKKTLATLLVAGALAAAGMSASAAISAAADTSGQSSVAAIGWWPDSTRSNGDCIDRRRVSEVIPGPAVAV